MKIDIKEIFKSDLDPNSPAWWSTPKIDKVNYNFYQLKDGGMPGPDGSIGPDGDFGAVGSKGFQGATGYKGFQGFQGAAADTDWLYFHEDAQKPGYLFPKKISTSGVQYAPTPISIGIRTNDNYGGINRYENPTGYGDCVVLSNVNTTNNTGSIKSNLRLSHSSKVCDFKLSETNNLHIGKFISSDPNFSIIQYLTTSTLKSYNSAGVGTIYAAHVMDNTSAIINEMNNANAILSNSLVATTISNSVFNYNVDANINYILASDNTAGNVRWRKKRELFPSFPIGSIISIRSLDLISTYFYLNETIIQQPIGGVLPALNIRWGRGKSNTQYSGWYICNGKEWKPSDSVSPSYLVPNLNSYDYSIASNGAGQHTVTGAGNNSPILIGGSDILLNATQSAGVYNILYGNTIPANNNGTSIILDNTSLTPNLYVTKQIHIIYLERDDLIWQDPGV
jgi:hypothetical protein